MRDKIDALFTDQSPLESLEDSIEKQASQTEPGTKGRGFADVWKRLVKTAVQHDWKTAVRRSELIEKDKKDLTPYEKGQLKAASFAQEVDCPELSGFYSFISETYNEADSKESFDVLAKEAAEQYDRPDLGRKEVGYWSASIWAHDRGKSLDKLAWQAPTLLVETAEDEEIFERS